MQWIDNDDADRSTSIYPVLVFPEIQADGSQTWQVKPQSGSMPDHGKYIGPGRDSHPPKLIERRGIRDAEAVLIVEGTKQGVAAAAYAPEDCAVYSIPGITGYMVPGTAEDEPSRPTPMLAPVVKGRGVVIIPDSDAATKLGVYRGAERLGEISLALGAKSVRFARVPGTGPNDGLDDVLGVIDGDDDRRIKLAELIEAAGDKPARLTKKDLDRMEAAQRRKDRERRVQAAATELNGRPGVNLDGDPLEVATTIVAHLDSAYGGVRLFSRNGRIVRLIDGEAGLELEDLTSDSIHREILDIVCPFSARNKQGIPEPMGVPKAMLGIVLDHAADFPGIKGITRTPIVHADGAVITRSGYDTETQIYLDLSADIEGLEVPDHPTDAQLGVAADRLREAFPIDGQGGFDGLPISEAGRTSLVGMILTPAIRHLVPAAPAFLANGIQPGVGKGVSINAAHLLNFGVPAAFQSTPTSEEEMDKRLGATVLERKTAIILDEVVTKDGKCLINNKSLAAFLTAPIYQGRRLGHSHSIAGPNLTTVFMTGNNVSPSADIARRLVQIKFDSDRPDLETRGNFAHDMTSWILGHRRELLTAVLTLVRAWFDRGQPAAPQNFSFGSFEDWQRIVGGILHLAGFGGFLDHVLEDRADTDNEVIDNFEFLTWVETVFPAGTRFAARELLQLAKADPDAPAPYGYEWMDFDNRVKALSQVMGRTRRRYGDLQLVRDGKMHGAGTAYKVQRFGSTTPPSGPTPPVGPVPPTSPSSPDTPPSSPDTAPVMPANPVVPTSPETAPVRTPEPAASSSGALPVHGVDENGLDILDAPVAAGPAVMPKGHYDPGTITYTDHRTRQAITVARAVTPISGGRFIDDEGETS
ncbi:hypothetical protein [Acidipropionibacterium acidipropionici]|uniref:hypothetical protein n=1 Tax=Acidipropionibacterium acidipropionici TaxID=1748 RepID=UPI000406DD46|nr:hypothetical protein [Acidipropionibacterium acidipropionici]ALN14340.1 hypothetical protein ASQ49_02615 [Acidipropionibacterium acidipropionici]APZ09897.1 hypothetical protein BWX38_12335 [Acidipropionibacterium acidipropionici]